MQQLIRNCRIFVFAPNCLAESVLTEMWSTLFADYVKSSSEPSIWYMVNRGKQVVDTNPNKVRHCYISRSDCAYVFSFGPFLDLV